MMRWFRDTYVVFSMEVRRFLKDWEGFAINSLISSATFIMLRLMTVPPPDVEVQLLAGAIVFAVGMQSVNVTGGLMVSERFEGQMTLFRTSPMSPGSYVTGVTTASALTAMLTAVVVLGIAAAVGTDFHLSLLLLPLLIMTALALPGFAVLIATHVRTAQAGYMLSSTVGILVVLVSPIFYPIERLPEWLQWVARISPFTHAGQAFREVLTGGSSILVPVVVLLVFMVATNILGITRMRWREP
jgi:ABC-type multidrug transport system permease subunit